MIPPADLSNILTDAFPGAEVQVVDRTGSMDHYQIRVVAEAFREVGLMDRHRMVMGVLQPYMADGRVHAAEIQTAVPGA